jgi:hypothetical protein
MLPVVFKVLLDFLSHFGVQRHVFVKMSEQAKPLGQVFWIFVVSGHWLIVHKDLDELGHNVGETGYADEKNKGCYGAFKLTFGHVVAKPDSW